MNAETISDPAVTIILPIYNAERVLNTALDSALGQTLREVEVIAVDDGSTDRSRQILNERAAADPRLRVLLQPENRGTLSARNRGLRECRGKYVMFLDPDDFLESNAAEQLAALAERKQADIVHFATKEFTRLADGTMKPLYNWTAPPEKEIAGPGSVLRDLLLGGHNWSLCLKLIRTEICRKALAEIEDFFCVMGEDLYFYLAAAGHAGKMIQTGTAYYHYDTTVGITSVQTVSPEKFKRTATLLDALNHGEQYLRSRQILNDPELAAGWEKLVRGQYLILWNRWHSRLKPGERGEIGEYLLHHAGNKELFLLSIFDENEYLRKNEEFLKFSRLIFRVMNCIFPENSWLRMKLKTWYKKTAAGKGKK